MQQLFSMDSFLGRFLSKVVDFVCLGMIWILSSIPVFTIGASATALYYTVNKVLRNDRSSIWREYWSAFKANFKQSTIILAVMLIVCVVLGAGFYYAYVLFLAGALPEIYLIVLALFAVILIVWLCYLFPYVARFTNSTREVIKNCALITLSNLFPSLLLLVVLVAAVTVMLITPMGILIVPVGYTWLSSFAIERIFRKYMSPEDVAAEEERNAKQTIDEE